MHANSATIPISWHRLPTTCRNPPALFQWPPCYPSPSSALFPGLGRGYFHHLEPPSFLKTNIKIIAFPQSLIWILFLSKWLPRFIHLKFVHLILPSQSRCLLCVQLTFIQPCIGNFIQVSFTQENRSLQRLITTWFSPLHSHFLLHNFAKVTYFIIQKTCAVRADQGREAERWEDKEKVWLWQCILNMWRSYSYLGVLSSRHSSHL